MGSIVRIRRLKSKRDCPASFEIDPGQQAKCTAERGPLQKLKSRDKKRRGKVFRRLRHRYKIKARILFVSCSDELSLNLLRLVLNQRAEHSPNLVLLLSAEVAIEFQAT